MHFKAQHEKDGCADVVSCPGYPFSAQFLFSALQQKLRITNGAQMSFDRLAQMIGKSKSTTHHWFNDYTHPQVLAFMCLLEWLPEVERNHFINQHCRVLPILTHPTLAGRPAALAKLQDLLRENAGLTFITATMDWMRVFLVTALGHSFNLARAASRPCLGIDIHNPLTFVPVSSLFYIDPGANSQNLRKTAERLIPKVVTASGTLLLFNGVWSAVPTVRPEIVRASKLNNVVVAEASVPDPRYIKQLGGRALHRITVSPSKRLRGGINVFFRSKSPLKP